MFAGLVFRRCKNLKRISLATIAYCESNAPLEELKQILKCKSEKRPEGVALEINYRDRSQLHDREIRL
jgi:hypothetical protein